MSGDPTPLPLNKLFKQTDLSARYQKFEPRRYQKELLRKAIEQNVIIYLGTGLGKTFVTVLYLNTPQVAEQIRNGRKVVFLAPTQDLIKQQAEYVWRQVPYKVKIFCGRSAHCGEHIDHWDKDVWAREMNNIDIMFMTPQILHSATASARIHWKSLSTLIIDECHHASMTKKNKESGNPMAQLLKHLDLTYDINPGLDLRVIGLTASLINAMPNNESDIDRAVAALEKLVRGVCVTDITVMDSKPKMIIHSVLGLAIDYKNDLISKSLVDSKDIMTIALKMNDKIVKQLNHTKTLNDEQKRILSFQMKLKLSAVGISIKPGSFPKILDGLRMVRERCGLYACATISYKLSQAIEKHWESSLINTDLRPMYENFRRLLETFRTTLKGFLPSDPRECLIKGARPKLLALLDVLKQEYDRKVAAANDPNAPDEEPFSCIVFVRSRLEVVALNDYIQEISRNLPEYKFIRCSYAIGIAATMNSKYSCITKRKPFEQYRMLNDFRQGLINTIITTSVLEEGIDLPRCSAVIRYDEPRNFREYVQSRGRARQAKSLYVTICDNHKVVDINTNLLKLNHIEMRVKERLKSRDLGGRNEPTHKPESSYQGGDDIECEDFYLSEDCTVRVSSTMARTVLNMYCNHLATRTPFSEGVKFEREIARDGKYVTTLYLPSGCPLEFGIKGNPKSEEYSADNSAVVAAIKALIEANELDEGGVPRRLNEKTIDDLLSEHNLNFDIEPIIESPDNIVEKIAIGEQIYYRPAIFDESKCLYSSPGPLTLFKVSFSPVAQNEVREDTLKYFEKAAFGMIVDSRVGTDFLPSVLYSHYGTFKVDCHVIEKTMVLSREDHTDYLNFTHKLLFKCMSIKNVYQESFQKRCQFYLIPLNSNDRPDLRKMAHSFRPYRGDFRVGDVVQIGHLWHDGQQNYSRNATKLMVVKRICHDMNADSQIPNRRQGATFFSESEFRYGPGTIRVRNQPVIQVMPIASQFASTKQTKKIVREYSTTDIYYLSQFLELFDSDANIVFQAFNYPEIIYRLYRQSSLVNLNEKFLAETKDRRQVIRPKIVWPSSSDSSEKLPADDQIEQEVAQEQQRQEDLDEDASQCEPHDSLYGELVEGEEDQIVDNEIYDTEDTSDSDDEDSDCDIVDKFDIFSHMFKKELNLNGGDDEDKFAKWNLKQFRPKNISQLDIEHRSTNCYGGTLEQSENFCTTFSSMYGQIDSISRDIGAQLAKFESAITIGGGIFADDETYQRRFNPIDKSIEIPITFDRRSKSHKQAPVGASMIEAFTLRKAAEKTNLEMLENIGDSYLKYMVSVVLCKRINGDEGFLTSSRMRLISNELFNFLVRKSNLGPYAITIPFKNELLVNVLGGVNKSVDPKDLYSRMRPKDLSDLFESFVGSCLIYRSEFEAILACEWMGLKIFDKDSFDEFHEGAVVFSRFPSALVSDESYRLMTMFRSKLAQFESIIGYKFNDISFLIQAFTHSSSPLKCTRSYERLEFLGDAVLDFLTTATLFASNTFTTPGQITFSRSALVRNTSFAKIAITYAYDLFIQHCSSDLYQELVRLAEAREEEPDMKFIKMIDFDRIVKLLADVFESVAGAIYLDSGCSLDTVWRSYYPMMKAAIDEEIANPTRDLKSLLFETFPGIDRITYDSFVHSTPSGEMVGVRLTIRDYGYFTGVGISKRQARERAFEQAFERLPDKETIKNLNEAYLKKYGAQDRGRSSAPRAGSRGRMRGRGAGRGGRDQPRNHRDLDQSWRQQSSQTSGRRPPSRDRSFNRR